MKNILLFVAMLVIGYNSHVFAFAGGTGSRWNPYQISTKAHLDMINSVIYPGVPSPAPCFILVNDIDLTGQEPYDQAVIDNMMIIFDGNGKTIRGLKIIAENESKVGLFGNTIIGTRIINLKLEDVFIVGDREVGGLCGVAGDSIEIDSCYVSGTIVGQNYVGGLVGENSGQISQCHTDVKVEGNTEVGGFCGSNSWIITTSYSNGNVSGQYKVGGFCGTNIRYTGYSEIVDCYSNTTVLGDSIVAGFCGFNTSRIKYCYSTGKVTGNSGVDGFCSVRGTDVFSSFWDVQSSGVGEPGDRKYNADGLNTQEMQNIESFTSARWDFTGDVTGDGKYDHWLLEDGDPEIWKMMAQRAHYPLLSWQEEYLGDIGGGYGVDLEDVAELASGWGVAAGYTFDDLLNIAENWLAGEN